MDVADKAEQVFVLIHQDGLVSVSVAGRAVCRIWKKGGAFIATALQGGLYGKDFGVSDHSLAPQYLQWTASASWPSLPQLLQAWVETWLETARDSSTVTMPVGTAMMP